MKIYSLFDRKLREYGQLVTMVNDDGVMRAMKEMQAQSNGGSTLEKYPEDFDLMCVGEFDPQTGILNIESAVPRLVCNVASLIGGGA